MFIKNLPQKAEAEVQKMLEELFSKYKISSLLVKIDKGTEKPFAFVCFDTHVDAETIYNEYNG